MSEGPTKKDFWDDVYNDKSLWGRVGQKRHEAQAKSENEAQKVRGDNREETPGHLTDHANSVQTQSKTAEDGKQPAKDPGTDKK